MERKRIIREIKRHSKFLITSHVSLEGDALGSELALASLLRKLGKKSYIVNETKVPFNYDFLPGVKNIYQKLNSRLFQAAFIVDCPDKGRVGNIANLIDNTKPIINIDHHLGNSNFGKVNWIDSGASSTGEMIYKLFQLTKTKLDQKDALNLYTAILTDTGSFRHANTTSRVLSICSELLKFGIQPNQIYSKIYENNPVRDIICAARAISRIATFANNTIGSIKITKSELEKINNRAEIFDKIFEFVKSVETIKAIVILSQQHEGFIKLSLRSKSPISVQRVALAFGGGGHKFASGCVIKGSLEKAEQMVLKRIKEELARKSNKR